MPSVQFAQSAAIPPSWINALVENMAASLMNIVVAERLDPLAEACYITSIDHRL